MCSLHDVQLENSKSGFPFRTNTAVSVRTLLLSTKASRQITTVPATSMSTFLKRILFLSLGIPVLAGRYLIDPVTCKHPEVIESAMGKAFNLAQAASDAINKQPLTAETTQNLQFMFGGNDVETKLARTKAVFDGGRFILDRRPNGVLSYNHKAPVGTVFRQLGRDDVVCYCCKSCQVFSSQQLDVSSD